jgi:uncharacterized protein
MKRWLQRGAAAFAGLLCGLGLVVSGMTDPAKVVGFLDLGGKWDASLMLVMVGAITAFAAAYRLLLRRSRPLLAAAFFTPDKRSVDGKLLLGAAVFGLGWGLGGFCPGPAIVSLGAFTADALVFVIAMTVGMVVAGLLERVAAASALERRLSE